MPTIELPLNLIDQIPTDCVPLLDVPSGEAVHTGGLYFKPATNEVYKPLDVRPYQNCPVRIRSNELEALEAAKGLPGFPKNWRVEEDNERLWLVRPKCLVVGQSYPAEFVTLAMVEYIQDAVARFNKLGWGLHEFNFTVAIDPTTREPFVLDLSNAQKHDNERDADDSDSVLSWAGRMGLSWLEKQQSAARRALTDTWFGKGDDNIADLSYTFVYRINGDEPPAKLGRIKNGMLITKKRLSDRTAEKHRVTHIYGGQ